METGRERIARMKEYTLSLLGVFKAGKISVADAERYVDESERLLRAEVRLREQQWPKDELPRNHLDGNNSTSLSNHDQGQRYNQAERRKGIIYPN